MNAKKLMIFPIMLMLFTDPKTNTTTQTGSGKDLSVEMKTYYSDYLIDLAEPELVHDQFGQKHPIPKNGGKTIEFRQYDPLPEMTTALTEGVTPDGQSLNVKKLEATVKQYGGYVTLSDLLMLTAIDNNLVQATKLIASQAGRTLDTITREVLNAGTIVQYADGAVSARADLVGGSATESENNYLTVDAIKQAVRTLEAQDAPKINGYYVGIIHPNVKYDLMKDPDWKTPHEYVDTANVYQNEIGELYGVRFVQSSRAKVWTKAAKNKATGSVVATDRDVYSTLILADDAYGVTDISGGGLQHIVKQLGSAGSGDPLDQRATVGWKATKTAEILVQQYMVRIETTASV